MGKSIGILTSGGDAPGMNAALRAVVRYGIYSSNKVFGIERGYEGLVDDVIFEMDRRSVSDILHRGGTILKTARLPEFLQPEVQRKAAENLKNRGIDGLVVIGGDGSFRGARELSENFGINTIGIPGTIDNDLAYTDYTLGFDSAVNTVLWAINNLRDTMTSHDRVCIIEVMGRRCGDIAIYSALSGGAEGIIIPEEPQDFDKLCGQLKANYDKGKTSNIIILAEGVCHAEELKAVIKEKIGLTVRTSVLGHIQRGGSPSNMDRVLAALFGKKAVDLINEGKTNRVVGIRHNAIIDMDINEALSIKSKFNEDLYETARILSL
ncbi:MAG: 6-phosphofructokinase [Clostridia bacterium]|nr:6-phosphofructokinase [Clostridia bacterium]